MAIVVAGGTGFLGSALVEAFAADGRDVIVLTRKASSGQRSGEARQSTHAGPIRGASTAQPRASVPRLEPWTPDGTAGAWASTIDNAEAVVNLAGEPIAGRRWSAAHKQRILDSRVQATRSLAAAIGKAATPPPVFVSGSAVGYYGPLGDEIAAEGHWPGSDFLAQVCVQWEAEAAGAASPRTRVVYLRTGLVLERDGGALPKMLPPFKLGAGGPIGSGRQYWPWIHRQDWIDLVRFAVQTPAISGPLNLTAPSPVTNADFARALGRALHRPSFLPTPGVMLKVLLGEMAEALLLSGQRAVPAKAENAGYRFAFKDLDTALASIFR
jgi:uncharacterized protein (TIGR01777 family)